MRLEGLGKLKKKSTPSGLEPATFRIVAQCVNQLRYRVPSRVQKLNLNKDNCQKDPMHLL
jgi:hypothetical protein